MPAYADDLAYIHDVGFGGFAEAASPGLLTILAAAGIDHARVIDLGCGSGIWARIATRAGHDVLGIDISRAMVAIARRKAPRATFRVGSYLEVPFPTCDAVTSMGECLNYLLDAGNGPRALDRLFRRVYAALRPGGLLVFDVAGPGRARGTYGFQREGRDWAILGGATESADGRILTRRITTFRRVDGRWRRGREEHRLRLYRPAEVARRLRRVGFRTRALTGYGELRFVAGHAGFVARRPA